MLSGSSWSLNIENLLVIRLIQLHSAHLSTKNGIKINLIMSVSEIVQLVEGRTCIKGSSYRFPTIFCVLYNSILCYICGEEDLDVIQKASFHFHDLLPSSFKALSSSPTL